MHVFISRRGCAAPPATLRVAGAPQGCRSAAAGPNNVRQACMALRAQHANVARRCLARCRRAAAPRAKRAARLLRENGPQRQAMQMQHCIFDAASLPQENEQTTGLIILHLIRCLQTLRAAALRLMRAKGSGQSNFSIICSICAQRVRCFWV